MRTLIATLAIMALPSLSEAQVECGALVTESITIGHDLACDGDGLIIGAPDITLDLGGHTLRAATPSDGIAIINFGFPNVTIQNGRIEGYGFAVEFFDTPGAVIQDLSILGGDISLSFFSNGPAVIQRNVIVDGFDASIAVGGCIGCKIISNVVLDGDTGIVVGGCTNAEISRNVVIGHSQNPSFGFRTGVGIEVNESRGTMVASNVLADNLIGIGIDTSGADAGSSETLIADNTVLRNGAAGILVSHTASATSITQNRVSRNGFVALPDTFSGLISMVAPLEINDGIFSVGTHTTLSRNVARRNAGLGIEALDAIDGGGNRASRNGDPMNCVGVTCGKK